MSLRNSKLLVQELSRSKIFQDYERAFSETTKMPLALRSAETWNMVQHGKKHENAFCSLMAQSSRTCAACLEVQEEISKSSTQESTSTVCFAGLCDTVVPIKLGSELLGFLQTGQVSLKAPTKKKFNAITKQLFDWGVKVDLKRLEEAYFHTLVITPKQYQHVLRLLEIFAQHLSSIANQVAVQTENNELPMVKKAKAYIEERKSDDLSLEEVAKAVNVSTFYFCKMFKKATGINFTEYLSRVRIEKAKNLLINPNLRISEIAFEVGFQSVTHFNRVFRKFLGQSPTLYRTGLSKVAR
jgi:YesN/AraC family two-component response regulator